MKIRRSEVTFVLTCLLFLMAGKVAGQAMDDDPTFAFEEAMQLLRSGDESKSKQAAQQLKKLAVDGHSRSQYWLAQLYFQGLGVGQSDQQGRLWIQRSAETGYAVAKLAQAEILLGGDEAAKDYEKARGFLEGVIAPEAASTMPPEEFGMYRNSKARASYLIGMFYQNGWGVELDKSKAVELFQLASRTGDKDASMMLAIAYAKGDGVERDAGRTKEYFELYDLQSVDEVNRSLENAIGGSEDSSDRQNLAETSKYLSEAVSSMVSAMQTEFAREVLEEGGEDYDPAFAATLLNLASENGYAEARMRLGLLCYRGLGVEEDKARASELFQLASEADWTLSQYNFAGMLLRGEAEAPKGMTARELLRKAATSGLFLAQVALEDNEADVSPVSPEEARDRCLEAAEAGDARAIYSLAIRKQSGWLVDVEEDFSKVVDLYRQSADSGYSRAQYVVGLMQMTGGGMPVDPMAGIARIRSAAYADLPEAIYTMGECYVSGIGVQPDPVEAYNHFLKASKLGYRNANNRLAAFHYYGILVPQTNTKRRSSIWKRPMRGMRKPLKIWEIVILKA